MKLTAVLRRRAVLYTVLVGWLTMLAIDIAFNPGPTTWGWIHAILYLAFTVALLGLLALRAVVYISHRARIKKEGGEFFTARFVKRFLIVGWLLAVLFRLATIYDLPNAVSGGPLWLFSAGLLAYFVYWLARRSRSGANKASGST
jgi:hypothetical protein